MRKSEDYSNKCGSCANYERIYKDGVVQEHGRCSIRGNYHNSSRKCCKKYEVIGDYKDMPYQFDNMTGSINL